MSPPFEATEFLNPSQFFQGNNSYDPLTAEVGDPGVEVDIDLGDLGCGVQECNLPVGTMTTLSVGVSSDSNQNAGIKHGKGTVDLKVSTGNRLEKTFIGKNYFNIRKKTSSAEAAASLGKHFDVDHQALVDFTMETIDKFKNNCTQFVKGRLRE